MLTHPHAIFANLYPIKLLPSNQFSIPTSFPNQEICLCRFGNTSSSSLWYELAYLEAKGRMKRGDRVWQIAFGSGFKCNSAVWKSLRNIKRPQISPWADCIDQLPVHVAEFKSIEPSNSRATPAMCIRDGSSNSL